MMRYEPRTDRFIETESSNGDNIAVGTEKSPYLYQASEETLRRIADTLEKIVVKLDCLTKRVEEKAVTDK